MLKINDFERWGKYCNRERCVFITRRREKDQGYQYFTLKENAECVMRAERFGGDGNDCNETVDIHELRHKHPEVKKSLKCRDKMHQHGKKKTYPKLRTFQANV